MIVLKMIQSHLRGDHKFEGHSHTAQPKEWKVITLENQHIKVFLLPEVGGKIFSWNSQRRYSFRSRI